MELDKVIEYPGRDLVPGSNLFFYSKLLRIVSTKKIMDVPSFIQADLRNLTQNSNFGASCGVKKWACTNHV